jgi:hypothetical protein
MSPKILAFEPRAVEELAGIASAIAEEKIAAGITIDARAREFIAACVMSCAANGETDPEKIRQQALSHAA